LFQRGLTILEARVTETVSVDRVDKEIRRSFAAPFPEAALSFQGVSRMGSMVVVMPEQPVPVLEEIPDDDYVDHQDDQHRRSVACMRPVRVVLMH
jgi:hypothetical protein